MLEGITAAVLPTSSGVRGSGGARGPAFLTSSRVVLMLAFCGGTREPNRAGEEPEGDPAAAVCSWGVPGRQCNGPISQIGKKRRE